MYFLRGGWELDYGCVSASCGCGTASDASFGISLGFLGRFGLGNVAGCHGEVTK
jgi:hypothetical protein